MKIKQNDPPRAYTVGINTVIQLKDCAHIELAADEQITLKTESGAEYDVTRKSWGFYATPSLNGRLKSFGMRAALVKSPTQRYYVLLLEKGKETEFNNYLKQEDQSIVCWLDDDNAFSSLEEKLNAK